MYFKGACGNAGAFFFETTRGKRNRPQTPSHLDKTAKTTVARQESASLRRDTLETHLRHGQQPTARNPQPQRIPPEHTAAAGRIMQVGDGQLHLFRARGIEGVLHHTHILGKGLGMDSTREAVQRSFPWINTLQQCPSPHLGGLTSTQDGQSVAQGHGYSRTHGVTGGCLRRP